MIEAKPPAPSKLAIVPFVSVADMMHIVNRIGTAR